MLRRAALTAAAAASHSLREGSAFSWIVEEYALRPAAVAFRVDL